RAPRERPDLHHEPQRQHLQGERRGAGHHHGEHDGIRHLDLERYGSEAHAHPDKLALHRGHHHHGADDHHHGADDHHHGADDHHHGADDHHPDADDHHHGADDHHHGADDHHHGADDH